MNDLRAADGHDHTAECDCLPIRVVVDQHGHYWRDYGDHWSMCPVSPENVSTEPISEFYPLAATVPPSDPPGDLRSQVEGLPAYSAPKGTHGSDDADAYWRPSVSRAAVLAIIDAHRCYATLGAEEAIAQGQRMLAASEAAADREITRLRAHRCYDEAALAEALHDEYGLGMDHTGPTCKACREDAAAIIERLREVKP